MTGTIQVDGLIESDITGSVKIVGLPSYNDIAGTIYVKAYQTKNLWLYATTSDKYKLLATKDEDSLYFLEDTKEVYKGSTLFSGTIELYSGSLPTKGAQGKIYFNVTSLVGDVWNGSAWKTISRPIMSFVDATSEEMISGQAVGAAVKEHTDTMLAQVLANSIVDITYDNTTHTVKFTKGGTAHDVPITKICNSLSYNPTTGALALNDDSGAISTASIPLDNYVVSGIYNDTDKAIELTLKNSSKVIIPATDLVNIYHAGNTATTSIVISNVDGNNIITVNIKVSTTANNAITANSDGLYMDKESILKIADPAKENNIVIVGADGHKVSSDISINNISTITYVNDMNTTLTNSKASVDDIVNTVDELNKDTPRETMMVSEKVLVSNAWGTL
jgi:hypothetical protein